MSLLNVHVEHERAIVGVDTACGLPPGQSLAEWAAAQAPGQLLPAELSKLFTIAHLGAVIACRGTALFGLEVFCAASMLPSVDAIDDSMLELLARISAASDARHAAGLVPHEVRFAQQEVVLVGWSEREGGMIATAWKREAGAGQQFTAAPVDRYTAPWEDEQGPAIEPRTDADMLELARAQVSYVRGKYPGAPIGGRLFVAEVTLGTTVIRHAGALGAHETEFAHG